MCVCTRLCFHCIVLFSPHYPSLIIIILIECLVVAPLHRIPIQTVDASIADILTFRQALSYMDDEHPFSFSFGPASTRAECVKSAQSTFKRLADTEKTVSFDVLALLAVDDNGVADRKRSEKIKQLFRPDNTNSLTQLAFVQSCDAIYRRLRYFRASVGNSSVIDKVLEDMLDGVFNSALAMVLMTMLGFNPYPLLVSISTLLVSFAFAFGASAALYVEGIAMIAIRRPYDLGDRITIDLPTSPSITGAQFWYVEGKTTERSVMLVVAANRDGLLYRCAKNESFLSHLSIWLAGWLAGLLTTRFGRSSLSDSQTSTCSTPPSA